MSTRHLLAAVLIAALDAAMPSSVWAESLEIHEWGTFTAFQDETGRAIGGINVDDEPVPAFVHDAAPGSLSALNDQSPAFQKGWPAGDPTVTMRLETPVLYVHPGSPGALTLDVRVDFRGGWLTQFYPNATAIIPGHRDAKGQFTFAPISSSTVGSLHWPEVGIGGSQAAPPQTTAAVWIAPRQVAAAPVTVGKEGEAFLFYRGIGHLDAPVRVVRGSDGILDIHPTPELNNRTSDYWLVDIRADGRLAYRQVSNVFTGMVPISAGPETFTADEYGPTTGAELRQGMLSGLMRDGLFEDEAKALLATWQASYFRSPGLRLFFLVPQEWTDRVLPLTVSPSAVIKRTMVGRIEIISPVQRAQLAIIAAGPTSSTRWWNEFLAKRVYDFSDPKKAVFRAHGQEMLRQANEDPGAFARLGLSMPKDYQAFLALGRFREALLQHALVDHPARSLVAFANAYGLAHIPVPAPAKTDPDKNALPVAKGTEGQ